MNRLTIAAAMFLAQAGFALAAPQSINDCEKIAEPDAYNRCLAMFGPAAKDHRASSDGPSAASPAQAAAPERSGRRYARHARDRYHGGHGFIAHRGHGRVRMVIQMGRSRTR